MTSKSITAAAIAVLVVGGAVAFAGSMPDASAAKHPAFDRMKTLEGAWEGKTQEGKSVSIEYRVISDGSAVMEHLTPAGMSPMVTIYYPDGDRLMMTHYCSAHNQPRMRAKPAAGEIKSLTFEFVDATNLASPDAGHMNALVLTFDGADHLTQEWTWKDKEQTSKEVFHLGRKK